MQTHEATQAQALITHCLATGTLSVFDGEEWTVTRSRDPAAIFAALATTSDDTLKWRDLSGAVMGTFWLIYGNGPGELVADFSDTPACNVAWQVACG